VYIQCGKKAMFQGKCYAYKPVHIVSKKWISVVSCDILERNFITIGKVGTKYLKRGYKNWCTI